MRRYRRLVLMDRAIPFLAAFVGLVALAGAVLVQADTSARTRLAGEEIAAIRAEMAALAARAETLAQAGEDGSSDSGVVDAMLALQDRMDALEAAWEMRPEPVAAPLAGTGGFASADGSTAIDPEWPTENCIPIGTRFMASVGDEFAICQSPVVVRVSAVTDDNVLVQETGLITETAFKPIPNSNCQLSVFSADAEGFAELRVSCN